MNITRRSFVRLSGMAALSAALVGPLGEVFGQALSDGDLYRIPVESTNDPLNYLLRAHFEPFVGTTLRAGIEGRAVNFRLIAVTDLSRAANEKRGYRGESFSLLFEGSSKKRLLPGSYAFDHGNLGKFTLSLAEVGSTPNRYEAIVNRISR